MNFMNLFTFFIQIQLWSTIATSLRTCTVIAPEFIHSGRKLSISLAVNNVNTTSQFEVTIESTNYRNSQPVDLQPDGVQIVDFNLPILHRDEYVLRVIGESGIHVEQSTFLKFATYKPIFVIQTDRYVYRRGETLHYRIICMDENLRPRIPDGAVEVKVMTQDHRIVYHRKSLTSDHFVISGEIYLNNFEIFNKSLRQFVARLTAAMNNEILASTTFQIENDDISFRTFDDYLNVDCKLHQFNNNSYVASSKVTSSKAFFTVQLENGSHHSLKQNTVASFKLNSSIPFPFFVYNVIGRGNVVLSERIQLLESETEYNFQLKLTNRMAPLSKLLVYFIDENNNFHYDELMLNIERILENKITLFAPESIQPNQKFELNIVTSPSSYVGVLAIEELNGYKNCAGYNEDKQFKDLLHNFGGHNIQRGEITGTSILTTAKAHHYNLRQYKKIWTNEENYTFEARAEKWRRSWLFAEVMNTTSQSLVLRHNLPNENSKWRITAFALNSEIGLAYTHLQPTLETTETYNLTFKVPDFIYEQEIINIPLRIENSLSEEIHLRVECVPDSYDIELIATFMNSTDDIIVPERSHVVLRYTIRSASVGKKSAKFLFFSAAGDSREVVHLMVKPRGMAIVENQYLFIDLNNSSSFTKQIWPDGSYNQETMTEYPFVRTSSNLIEPFLEFLSESRDDQIAEHAVSTMALTCLGLNYLKLSNKQDTPLETQLLRNMHTSFLSILDYRDNQSGSFHHFLIPKSVNGSMWLTAYASNWLNCARKHIDIDETIIEKALDYLASNQNSNGSFEDRGVYLNSITENNTLAMTAHVLLAFLENDKYYEDYKTVLENGIFYVVENLIATENLYAKALSTYVLYKAGFRDLLKELNNLDALAQTTDDYKLWAQGNDLEIANAATTALVLLTASGISDDFEHKYGCAMKWLIEKAGLYNFKQKGLYPNYASVFGFDALIRFALHVQMLTRADLTIRYRGLFRMEYEEFELRKKESEKHYSLLDKFIGGLEIDVAGQGYLIACVTFNYNVFNQRSDSQFDIQIERPNYRYMVSFVMNICITYGGIKEIADLTILEVNIPSGYAVETEHLKQIEQNKFVVKHAAMNTAGSVVRLYLTGLQRDKTECVLMEPNRVHSIAKQVPVPIICYEYTDYTKMAIVYYDVKAGSENL